MPTISANTVFLRCKRRLAHDRMTLRRARPYSYERHSYGEYYVEFVDGPSGDNVIDRHVNLLKMARKLDCLRPGEELAA
jgi:hypothetical protein